MIMFHMAHQDGMWDTYHGRNDGKVIFVQLATTSQSRSQSGENETESDEGEDD